MGGEGWRWVGVGGDGIGVVVWEPGMISGRERLETEGVHH